jgi:hypothetical protein
MRNNCGTEVLYAMVLYGFYANSVLNKIAFLTESNLILHEVKG